MLSVVIPTYNRASILKTCLERLFLQTDVEFEVIVVDDGSTDDTADVVSKFQNLKYIKQEKSQQGVARNRGVAEATGDIIVFIGDDIFVESGFLKAHAQTHAAQPNENVVVLGFSTWDPTLEINHYMKFLESSGWQFGYSFISPGFITRADRYKFFYTSNISMKKSFFEREKFDESFRGYGWEDIELGYRLFKNHHMQLFYQSSARAHHFHPMTEADLPKKMQAIGRSAKLFEKLHPEVRLTPRGFKWLLIRLATLSIFMPLWRLLGKNLYYKAWSWREFLVGE